MEFQILPSLGIDCYQEYCMDNIIKFPTRVEEETYFAEFEDKIMSDAKKDADDNAEFVWSCVLMDMVNSGYNLDRTSDEMKTGSILILESIRSLHYLTKGIEHPLQEVSKELFELDVKAE